MYLRHSYAHDRLSNHPTHWSCNINSYAYTYNNTYVLWCVFYLVSQSKFSLCQASSLQRKAARIHFTYVHTHVTLNQVILQPLRVVAKKWWSIQSWYSKELFILSIYIRMYTIWPSLYLRLYGNVFPKIKLSSIMTYDLCSMYCIILAGHKLLFSVLKNTLQFYQQFLPAALSFTDEQTGTVEKEFKVLTYIHTHKFKIWLITYTCTTFPQIFHKVLMSSCN